MNEDHENNQPAINNHAPDQSDPVTRPTVSFDDDTTITSPSPQYAPVQYQSAVTAKKSYRGLKATVIILAAVLMFALVGLAVFYFLVRTPDSQYEAAIANLEGMKSSALAIRDQGEESEVNEDVVARYESVRSDASVYIENLEMLKSNEVLTADLHIRAKYAEHSSVIEPYGQETLDVVDTAEAYLEIKNECETAVQEIYAGSNEEQFKSRIAACEKLLDKYRELHVDSIADWYQTYRTKLLDLIDVTYTYFMIQKYGTDADKTAASEDVQEASIAFGGAMSVSGTIANTKDRTGPSDEITEIIDMLTIRRDVLFRW